MYVRKCYQQFHVIKNNKVKHLSPIQIALVVKIKQKEFISPLY
jgi:hypothetical protein